MIHRVPRPQFFIHLLADPGVLPFVDRWGYCGPEPSFCRSAMHSFLSGLHRGANLLAPGVPCAQHAEMLCTSDLPVYCPACHVGKFQCPHPPHTGVVTLLHHIHLVDVKCYLALASKCLSVTEEDERRFMWVSAVHGSHW